MENASIYFSILWKSADILIQSLRLASNISYRVALDFP